MWIRDVQTERRLPIRPGLDQPLPWLPGGLEELEGALTPLPFERERWHREPYAFREQLHDAGQVA
jgi:hypothetical protein